MTSPLQQRTDAEPYYYAEEPVQPRWSLIPRVSGVSTISTFFQWPRARVSSVFVLPTSKNKK